MRTLTVDELDFVSGGLQDKPPESKSLWESFTDWISSWFDGGTSSNGSGLPTLTGSDLGQMQRDCLNHGGDFSITAVSGSVGADFRMVDANGNVSFGQITCNQ